MNSFLNQIKLKFKALLNTGVNNTLNTVERKRVLLLNMFWVYWVIIQLVLLTEDYLTKEDPTLELIAHGITLCGVIIIGVLQKNQKFISARILFFVLMLYSNILFANVIEPGKGIEYFYLIIPPFLLLFTNNSKILYSMFIICYLLFIVPKEFLHIYPEGAGGSKILSLILFVIIFLQVNFFKRTNISSEKAIEKKRQQLEELNKHQSQFFINVSHEIRTPLTLIKGEVDKLQDVNKENISAILIIEEKINKQIYKIKKIVDDVIDLAKMKNTAFILNMEKHNLQKIVQKVHLSFEPLFKQKQISYSLHIATTIKNYVALDIVFFERALNNIMINALKYTSKKGSVTIIVKQEFKQVVIEIVDTGIGISENEIEKIFDRFYQVSNRINKSGGSGVGLAFSNEIIKKHNGELSVKSKETLGSTFIIKLPLLDDLIVLNNFEESVPKTLIKSNKPKNIPLGSKTILIVDDSIEMRVYLTELLENNYTCLQAENGEEALSVIKNNKIDFLLTDYMMPTMNGFELIKAIKQENYNFPVLMLTARTDNQSKINVLRLGIDDYMFKPFEKEELLLRIKNAIKNHSNRESFKEEEGINEIEDIQQINETLQKIKNYISEECGKNKILQVDVANFMCMSLSTLYRKVKSETGLTPNQFITEVKLLKAREIIEDKQVKSLKEISLEVGYSNTTYFSKLYFNRFGVKLNF